MTSPPVHSRRLVFLDGLRGIALVLMVLNHTARDWMDVLMGWGRYYLTYGSLLLPAATFLFLVGFCLPIGYRRAPARAGAHAAGKYLRRGAMLLSAGYVLNVLVTPDQPVWSSGVLHTIGLSIILLGPILPLLHHRAVRWTLLGVAGLGYLAFAWSLPALAGWCAAHPGWARVFFNDFPAWPWLAAPIVGVVLGWVWLEARARGPADEARFFARVAVVSVLALMAYVVWEWWVPTTPRFGFPRDLMLNRHWTPRGATTCLVVGGNGLLLAATYWLMEHRGYQIPWLVALGQKALMLYFVHQLIELTLVRNLLGLRFNNWWLYGAATAALLVVCVYLARAWATLEPRLRAGAA
jgi:uncharacterized membrane protein